MKEKLCKEDGNNSDISIHKNYNKVKKCEKSISVMKCISCNQDDGVWYSAVSSTGYVSGRVDAHSVVSFPEKETYFPSYTGVDIAVPAFEADDRLRKFAVRLSSSLAIISRKVDVKLLITRHPSDGKSSDSSETLFRKELAGLAGFSADDVKFVYTETDPDGSTLFNRARAINFLHRAARHTESNLLVVVDVDLSIKESFFHNAMAYVGPRSSAYFPIMWSEFNPLSVSLVEEFFFQTGDDTRDSGAKTTETGALIEKKFLPPFSPHRGMWRKFSFGCYAISGVDAGNVSMDENFKGWGGEDTDFFRRISVKLNVIRTNEHGLIHLWNPKRCSIGSTVNKEFMRSCVGSLAALEGSPLGMHLRSKESMDPEVNKSSSSQRRGQKDAMATMKAEETKREDSDRVDSVEHGVLMTLPRTTSKGRILIGVMTSRKEFRNRVRAIENSWGKLDEQEDDVVIRYFVGSDSTADGIDSARKEKVVSKPASDADLMKVTGDFDPSRLVVMSDINDDEYPPVHKNTAMMKQLHEIVEEEQESETGKPIDWVVKVDDDTLVNLGLLKRFVSGRDPENLSMFGSRGIGNEKDRRGLAAAGLEKPYCTGGPGFVMSLPALRDLVKIFDFCISFVEKSIFREFLWHSDVLTGYCMQIQNGLGCWEGKDYNGSTLFRQNYHWKTIAAEDFFMNEDVFAGAITMHPFKKEGEMKKQFEHIVDLSVL